IIMPEKNGYEVCEFVKSHPEYKTIPVILLTGTFEPFDPDRAERAGCDAVVTKPFESQSLIHKVEELIAHSAPAAAAPAAVPPSPFDDTHSDRRAGAAPADEAPFSEASSPSPEEIFGAPEPPPPPVDRSGSVFDETNPPGRAPEIPATPLFGTPEPPEQAAAFSAETTAFPRTSSEDQQTLQMAPPEPEPPAEEAPLFSAETTAFPKMSFADLQRMRDEAAAPPPEPEPAPPPPLEWPGAANAEAPQPEPAAPEAPAAAPSFGFAEEPKVVPFEPPQPPAFTAPEPLPEPEPEPLYSRETTAFPKMSFDDLQRMREEAPPPPPVDELPWTSAPAPLIGGTPEAPEPEAEAVPSAPPIPESAPAAPAGGTAALSDEEVDRIARRVVELMGEKAVRDIAWEVIPDLAQSIVRERIRELEKEEA
ncbi:MAG TPA: response regulator, partial [Thermoanaerobaculia bacterium]